MPVFIGFGAAPCTVSGGVCGDDDADGGVGGDGPCVVRGGGVGGEAAHDGAAAQTIFRQQEAARKAWNKFWRQWSSTAADFVSDDATEVECGRSPFGTGNAVRIND